MHTEQAPPAAKAAAHTSAPCAPRQVRRWLRCVRLLEQMLGSTQARSHARTRTRMQQMCAMSQQGARCMLRQSSSVSTSAQQRPFPHCALGALRCHDTCTKS